MTDRELQARFEVVWSGKALLCITQPDPPPVTVRPLRRRMPGELRSADDLAADRSAVLACVQQRPCYRHELRTVTGMTDEQLAVAMSHLRRLGQIAPVRRGLWRATV